MTKCFILVFLVAICALAEVESASREDGEREISAQGNRLRVSLIAQLQDVQLKLLASVRSLGERLCMIRQGLPAFGEIARAVRSAQDAMRLRLAGLTQLGQLTPLQLEDMVRAGLEGPLNATLSARIALLRSCRQNPTQINII